MTVRLFEDHRADADAWDAYVSGHPQAMSDHLWGWRRILAEAFGFRHAYYLAALEGERLTGVLPLVRVPKGLRGSALVSIPFGNYGGVCASSDAAASELLDAATRLMREIDAEYLELRPAVPLSHPSLQRHAGTHSRFVLPLTDDLQRHSRDFGPNNRNKVSKAQRFGLRVERSRSIDQWYPVYLHTARRQGTPCFPRRYFEAMAQELGDRVQALAVMHEGRCIAYTLLVVFRERMLCQFCGSLSEAYQRFPNELLFWSTIERACALGMKEFDFGRSRRESGTAQFKRKLRMQELPHDYQYVAAQPDEAIEAPAHRSRYEWAIRSWQRLPLPVTQCLGPRVLRYFA